MKCFLALSLVAVVLTHPDHGEFKKWAKNKAMESCWGEENMKIWTVRMKKAVAKCSQQDAPELLLPQFRSPYKTVNALLEAQENEENSDMDMQMMFHMFKFMNMMHQNQKRNNYNQFRPYNQDYDMADSMPMPMKWMMKMMMKNMHHDNDHHMDVMQRRDMDAPESFIKTMFKNAQYNKMNHHGMKQNNYNHQKHGMYGNMYDMQNSDMDFSDLFHSRNTRAAASNLDLGDRLVEKLKDQQQEMEEKVGNLTCILQEVNVLDANNEISVSSMKNDLEQYNLPSVWFKENYLELLDTCYAMATTLPAQVGEEYTVQGDFGSVNMAQVKMFMGCCSKAKAKLCMNYDIKQKIEENFGPLNDILTQSGLTENQLFPLVQNLLHGQESVLDDLF